MRTLVMYRYRAFAICERIAGAKARVCAQVDGCGCGEPRALASLQGSSVHTRLQRLTRD